MNTLVHVHDLDSLLPSVGNCLTTPIEDMLVKGLANGDNQNKEAMLGSSSRDASLDRISQLTQSVLTNNNALNIAATVRRAYAGSVHYINTSMWLSDKESEEKTQEKIFTTLSGEYYL